MLTRIPAVRVYGRWDRGGMHFCLFSYVTFKPLLSQSRHSSASYSSVLLPPSSTNTESNSDGINGSLAQWPAYTTGDRDIASKDRFTLAVLVDHHGWVYEWTEFHLHCSFQNGCNKISGFGVTVVCGTIFYDCRKNTGKESRLDAGSSNTTTRGNGGACLNDVIAADLHR
jgi:hypothetical protein